MTDEEMAEKYVDALLNKDDDEINKFLDEKLGDLQLNEMQAGTLLGIIKGIGICSFLAGAEFGYNKAFVEADKNLKAIVTDFNKANEWHRVSDKLPEMDVFVYLWKKGKDFPVVARRCIFCGQKEWVWDCMWGSGFTINQLKGRDCLWKEIILPKESEND